MRNKLLTLILAVALCFSMSFVLACKDNTPKVTGPTVVSVNVGEKTDLFDVAEGVAVADVSVTIYDTAVATASGKEVTGVKAGVTGAEISYDDTTYNVVISVEDPDAITNAIAAAKTELEQKITESVSSAKTELQTNIDSLKTALETAIADLGMEDIDGLVDQLDEIAADIAEKADAAEVKASIAALEKAVTEAKTALQTAIDNLDKELTEEIEAQIKTVNATIDGVKNSVTALDEKMTQAQADIDALEKAVADLEAQLDKDSEGNSLYAKKVNAKVELMAELLEKGHHSVDFSTIDAATTQEELDSAVAAIRAEYLEGEEVFDLNAYKANAAAEIIVVYENTIAPELVKLSDLANIAVVKEATTREREIAFVQIILANTKADVDEILKNYTENCEKIIEDYVAMEDFVDALDTFYAERETAGIVSADKDAIAALDEQYDKLSDEAKELLKSATVKIMMEDGEATVPVLNQTVEETVTPGAYDMIHVIDTLIGKIEAVYVAGDGKPAEGETPAVPATPLVVGGITLNDELVVIDQFLEERKDALTEVSNGYEALKDYQFYLKGEMDVPEDKAKAGAKAQDVVDLLHAEEYADEFIAAFKAAVIPEGATETTYNAYITNLYDTKIQNDSSRAWKQVQVKSAQTVAFWAFYNGVVGKIDGATADQKIGDIAAVPATPSSETEKAEYDVLYAAYVTTAETALASAKNVYTYGTKTTDSYTKGEDQVYVDRVAAVVGAEGAPSVKEAYNTINKNVVAAGYFAETVEENYNNIIANYETAYADAAAFIKQMIEETAFGGAAGDFKTDPTRMAFSTKLTTAYAALEGFAPYYVIDLPMDVYTVYTTIAGQNITEVYATVETAVNNWTATEGAKTPNDKVYNETYTAEAANTLIATYIATAKKAYEVVSEVVPYATSEYVVAKTRTQAMAAHAAYVELVTDEVATDYAAANNANAVTVNTHYNVDYAAAEKYLNAVIAHSFDAYTTTVETGEGEEVTTETKPVYETFAAGYAAEKAALSEFAQKYIAAGIQNLVDVYGDYVAKVVADTDLASLAAVKEEYAAYTDTVFGVYDLEADKLTAILTQEVVDKLLTDYVTSVENTQKFAANLFAGAKTFEKAGTLKADLAAVYEAVGAQTITDEYLAEVYVNVYADYQKLYGAIAVVDGKVTVPAINDYASSMEDWMQPYVGTGVELAKTLANFVAENASGETCVSAYEALVKDAPLAYYYLSDELQTSYREIERKKLINDAVSNIAIQLTTYTALTEENKTDENVAKIAAAINSWFKVFDEYLPADASDLTERNAYIQAINDAAGVRGFTEAVVVGETYTVAYEAARAIVTIPDLIAEDIVEKIDAFYKANNAFLNTPNSGDNDAIDHAADLETLFTNEGKTGLKDINDAITELVAQLAHYNVLKAIGDYTYGEVQLDAAVKAVADELVKSTDRKTAMIAEINAIVTDYTVETFKAADDYETGYNAKLAAFKEACEALGTDYNYIWSNDADITKNMNEVVALCTDLDSLVSGITSMNTIYFTVVPEVVAGMPAKTEEEKQAIRDKLIAENKYTNEEINNIVLRIAMTDEEILAAMEANVLALETKHAYEIANNAPVYAKLQAVRDDIAQKELEKEELAIAEEWLAEVNNFSAATPASDVAAAVAEVYTTFFNSDTIKTDVAREAVREKALELQAIVANDSKALYDLKTAYDAAKAASEAAPEDPDLQAALEAAETAYNEAVENFGYVFTDESGNKTLVISVASWGGNAYPFFFELQSTLGAKTLVISNIEA
jgi:lipoprotein